MNEMNVDMGGGVVRTVKVDYPSNAKSDKKKPGPEKEKEKQEKVITGTVTQRKKSVRQQIFGSFLSEDSGSVTTFVITEVLLPAAKNMLSDAVSQGLDRLLFGDIRPRRAEGTRTNYTAYGYQKPGWQRSAEAAKPFTQRQRATHDFSDYLLETRGDAEDVIDSLREVIEQYGVATVADLYDLLGISSEFTDNKWGWNDLRNASVRPVRGGYLLMLPKTHPVD